MNIIASFNSGSHREPHRPDSSSDGAPSTGSAAHGPSSGSVARREIGEVPALPLAPGTLPLVFTWHSAGSESVEERDGRERDGQEREFRTSPARGAVSRVGRTLPGAALVDELMGLARSMARSGEGDPMQPAQQALVELSKASPPYAQPLLASVITSLLECARLEARSNRFDSAEKFASIASLFSTTHSGTLDSTLTGESLRATALQLTLGLVEDPPKKERVAGLARELEEASPVLAAMPPEVQAEVCIAQAEYFFRLREPEILAASRELSALTLLRDRLKNLLAVERSSLSPEHRAHLSLQLGTALVSLGDLPQGLEQLRMSQQMADWTGAFGPLLRGSLFHRLGEALALRHSLSGAELSEALGYFEGAACTFGAPGLPSPGARMRSELAVLRTLRDSNRWPDAILRLEAFLETHNEVFNRYPLDHAEILLEAAVTYAGNGHVEGVHSARQRVISLLSEVALVEKAACRAERGLGIQAQGRAGIPSVLYPWCERSSSRISNLISKAVIFSVDNAQPGSVRELARRAFELYSKDPDSAARARAIQDHALVEAAIAIRSQQSILPPLTLTPLCAAQLSALADVVKGTIGDISLLPEAQRAAMVMRNHRVLALLELAQGKCDTFAVRAQNLLSLGQRLVVLGSSELKLEFARAALEAARGLTNRWDFASGYLQSITHKTEDPVSEDVRRLYIAAERGLSLGAGPLSFPAFLALQGVCQTDRVAAASSARNLEMRADMKLRLEELDRVYYCYGIEAFE